MKVPSEFFFPKELSGNGGTQPRWQCHARITSYKYLLATFRHLVPRRRLAPRSPEG